MAGQGKSREGLLAGDKEARGEVGKAEVRQRAKGKVHAARVRRTKERVAVEEGRW